MMVVLMLLRRDIQIIITTDFLGNAPITQNASGTVTSGVDGYTAPLSDSPSTT